MDPDELRAALHRWTNEGIVDEATAERIRSFEGVTDDDAAATGERDDAAATGERGDASSSDDDLLTDRRVVAALALMGSALVAVGVGTFLLQRWESIPRAVRAVVLLAVPIGAAVGGHRLRGRAPRTGHGLWLLAALFTGVTLFRLAELTALSALLGVDEAAIEPWLWLAWTAAAVAIAAGLDSRPVTAVGTALGAATLVTGIEGNPALLVGFYGGIVYAAGLFVGAGGRRSPDVVPAVGGTLRWLGGTFAAAVVATIGIAGSPPPLADDAGVVAVAVTAVVVGTVAIGRSWDDRRARYAATPTIAAPVGLGLAWLLGDVGGLGAVPVALVGLACLLGLLVALVVAAVGLREPALVNVATLGFVFGVLTFLVGPLADVVSGSLALVVAGGALIATALAAERGRREVLARIRS